MKNARKERFRLKIREEMNPIQTDKYLNKRPASISVEISTVCAMQCVYCSRKTEQRFICDLDFQKMKSYLDMVECRNVIFCGNGEALLHPQFYDYMKQLRNRTITLVTSGSISVDFEQLNFKDILIFSVDASTEELMKQVCGKQYKFDQLVENLERLSNRKKKEKSMITMLNCTINKYNVGDLENIIHLAKQYGLTAVHYSFPWGNEQFIFENKVEIYENLIECMELAKKNGIVMENPYDSFCCIADQSISPYIDIDGNYYSCAKYYYKNHRVGNIFDEASKEYVNSLKREDCISCPLALNERYKVRA